MDTFSKLDSDLVDKLYEKWGGRPRFVLVRALFCFVISPALSVTLVGT